jgi:hypothetical protein
VRGEHTVPSPWGVGAGAATTRFVSRTRTSRLARPVGWNMSLAGVFPMPPVSVYMCPTSAGCSRRASTTTESADDEITDLLVGFLLDPFCHQGSCGH